MKKLFYSLLILIWFCPACTTQKNVQKDKTSIKTETTSSQQTETNSKSNTLTTLQGFKITRITESLDTTAIAPGSFINGEKLLWDLLAGDHLRVESDDQVLDVFYDSLDKKIKASGVEKPDTLPMNVNKTTEIQESTNSQISKQDETSINDNKQIAEKRKVDTEHKELNVERTGWQGWGGIAIASIIIVAIAIWLFLLWRRKLF